MWRVAMGTGTWKSHTGPNTPSRTKLAIHVGLCFIYLFSCGLAFSASSDTSKMAKLSSSSQISLGQWWKPDPSWRCHLWPKIGGWDMRRRRSLKGCLKEERKPQELMWNSAFNSSWSGSELAMTSSPWSQVEATHNFPRGKFSWVWGVVE